MRDGYLTPQELCDRYKEQISLRTLANWRCSGEGPPYMKIGGRVLYRLEDIESWEAGRRMNSLSKFAAVVMAAIGA